MQQERQEPLLQKDLTLAELHAIPQEEFEALSVRDRYRLYFKHIGGANYVNPVPLLVVVYVMMGAMWASFFYYVVMDRSQDVFSDLNIKKFILYNIAHGVLGFGATCGPLGAKNGLPVGVCGLTFLTPGSLCSPLLPGFVGCIQRTPGRRGFLAVLTFLAYLAALVYAIIDPTEMRRLYLVNGTFAIASIFDTVIFFASRGEHYGYHMFCLMFPDCLAGCQWVQLMLWIDVGFSKCGPWFKYVIQVLAKDAFWSPCLPKHFAARFWMKDWPRDFSPSRIAHCLGRMGAIGEWVFPLCIVFDPGSMVSDFGIYGIICYHAFIWLTLPTASVFEWQYYCIYMAYALFKKNTLTFPTSPALIVFLVVVLLVLPIIGQLEPKLVPFLMAYRQYSGNWRMGKIIIKKSARAKFDNIRTWSSIWWWEPALKFLGGERQEFTIECSFLAVPQFRGQFSVFEKFFKDTGKVDTDFYFIHSFCFMNAVFGWDLAVGWLWFRDCFREAVVTICGLEEGDCYFLQTEPVNIRPPHNMQIRLFDAVKGPLDAEVYVDIPYSTLEGTHPCDLHLDPAVMKKGKSIGGTFLTTYY